MYLLANFVGYLAAIVTVGTIFLAGWLLELVGKDHGRWQSFTMFLPAVVLLFYALFLKRSGRKTLGAYMMSGLFFAFGVIVLIMG